MSNEEIMEAMAASNPQPAEFPDEPRPAVGDVAFGTGEDMTPPMPMVPKAVAVGAPPIAEAEIAGGVGLGAFAAQAAVAGVEMIGEAAKSPQGSIGAFLPGGGGGGGGQDYAGAALSRAMLAALNAAGNIPTRFGG